MQQTFKVYKNPSPPPSFAVEHKVISLVGRTLPVGPNVTALYVEARGGERLDKGEELIAEFDLPTTTPHPYQSGVRLSMYPPRVWWDKAAVSGLADIWIAETRKKIQREAEGTPPPSQRHLGYNPGAAPWTQAGFKSQVRRRI